MGKRALGEASKIEWTDHTFNPWVGCTKISPACDHCYAEGWAKRSGRVQWGEERRRTTPAYWRQPLKWNADCAREAVRKRVFCASLADIFDNEVPTEWRADLFRLIRATPHLDWLLLTKRIGNAPAMIERALTDGHLLTSREPYWPWPNVWLGATIANQEEADRDVPKLLHVPARVRFLSVEPMLGYINYLPSWCPTHDFSGGFCVGPCPDRRDVNWVICGGESGHRARPLEVHWASELREAARRIGAAFFMKQGSQANWGNFKNIESFPPPLRVREFPAETL